MQLGACHVGVTTAAGAGVHSGAGAVGRGVVAVATCISGRFSCCREAFAACAVP